MHLPSETRPTFWLVIALTVLAMACRGDGAGPDIGTDVPEGPRPDTNLASVLELLPDLDGSGLVALTDLAAARALLDLEVPDPDDAQAIADHRTAMTADDVALLAPSLLGGLLEERPGGLRDELGFALEDVTAIAEFGSRPTGATVFRGTFDGSVLDFVSGADAVWATHLTTGESHDARTWSWGADGEVRPALATPARPDGESIRLALADDRLARTYTTATLERITAAWQRVQPRLSADATTAELVTLLDDRGAVSAVLTRDVEQLSHTMLVGDADPPPGLVPLRAYTSVGVATTRAGDRPVLILALTHETDDLAAANATRLREAMDTGRNLAGRRWADVLGGPVVEHVGSAVVLEARPATADVWASLLLDRETLLVHD